MDIEIKKALDEQAKLFAEFKSANDERIAELKKLGDNDVLTTQKVDKINDRLTVAEEKAQKLHEEAMAKLNLIETFGGGNEEKKGPSKEEKAQADSFIRFVRRDIDGLSVEQKAMLVGSEPDGGFLVPRVLEDRIVTRQRILSNMRGLATVQTISTDALEMLADTGDVEASWVGEVQTRPDTNTPQLGKIRIPVHEIAAQPKASQKLLDDAQINVEEWLATKLSDRFSRLEGDAFINGDGSSKPRGIVAYTTAATDDDNRAWGTVEHIATGTSGGFGTDPNGSGKVLDVVHALKPHFLTNARFIGRRSTFAALRKQKDSDGNYIYVPSMVAGVPATVLGYGIEYMEAMPAIGANSLSLGFGDFKEAYTIVDRIGTRMMRDPYTDKPNVKFYTTKRVGGDVVNFEAYKLLKFATS